MAGNLQGNNGVITVSPSDSLHFGFLGIVIGYIPVQYQAFSRREVGISLLDARAGSPPTAGELLRRHGKSRNMEGLQDVLKDCEKWAADVLESHLSYPVVAYYRSQHDRQSWLAAMTAIMDACALISLGFQGAPAWQGPLIWQARMTYAMARHAIIDLALVFNSPPECCKVDRLPSQDWQRLCTQLKEAGIAICDGDGAEERLAALRAEYEPYVSSLMDRMLVTLPPWHVEGDIADNWQTSAWEHPGHFAHE